MEIKVLTLIEIFSTVVTICEIIDNTCLKLEKKNKKVLARVRIQ